MNTIPCLDPTHKAIISLGGLSHLRSMSSPNRQSMLPDSRMVRLMVKCWLPTRTPTCRQSLNMWHICMQHSGCNDARQTTSREAHGTVSAMLECLRLNLNARTLKSTS